MPLVALLDACVLVPRALCDTLLRCAEAGLFRVQWSEQILAESERAIAEIVKRPEAARRVVVAMRQAFPEAAVTGSEELIDAMTNHPKDRHVAAAAVAASAQVIVTHNIKDFPANALVLYGIAAQAPDDFLNRLFDPAPDDLVRIVREQAKDLQHPPLTIEDVLRSLGRHAPRFVQRLRERIGPSHSP